MNRGYIKFWRKAEDSVSWSRGLEHRGMMVTILDRAAWQPHFEWGIEVQPGEFLVKVIAWAETLGMSQTSVRRILKNLVEDGFISMTNVANRYTKITVLNWHVYQHGCGDGRRTDGEQTANPRSTNGEQTANPSYMEEEVKKEDINTPPLPPLGGDCVAASPTAAEKPSQMEPSQMEPSQREPSQREPSRREPSQREPSRREPSQREPSQREPSQREPSRREPSQRDPSRREPTGNSLPELKAAIEAFTSDDGLRTLLGEFRVMRERIRKPMTGKGLELILAKLRELAGGDTGSMVRIVEQSIANSWQGVFALKSQGQYGPSRASPDMSSMSRTSVPREESTVYPPGIEWGLPDPVEEQERYRRQQQALPKRLEQVAALKTGVYAP